MVLLDGEGIIFKDEFLQLGEEGGRAAAKQFHAGMHAYLVKNLSSINTPKIILKLYLNVKGFAENCARSGIITDPSIVYDFIRGFNDAMSYSEIVDVGSTKNKANDKIQGMKALDQRRSPHKLTTFVFSLAEMFQVFLYNCHCHQVFVGCSSTPDYARFLQETLDDGDLTGRVSLVEGVAFDKELDAVKASYRIAKFPDVFRSTKVAPIYVAPWKSSIPSRSLLTPSPSQQLSNPPPLSRTSTATSASGMGAPLAVSTPNKPNESLDFQQVVRSRGSGSSPVKTVERNKYGQRVDRLDFKSIPRDDLNRLKKLKLCNYFFLLGECPNEENCYHDHDRKLTKQELHILSAIARMTPCRFGLECDDPECIYGHRCPQSEPGKKTCFRGDSCRFEPVAHGIDTNIVKVTKI